MTTIHNHEEKMDHIHIWLRRVIEVINRPLSCRNSNLWTTSDTSELISSIARYQEEYCQQMLSVSLKFEKDIHFKYSNEAQTLFNSWGNCRNCFMLGSHDTDTANLFRSIVQYLEKYEAAIYKMAKSSDTRY